MKFSTDDGRFGLIVSPRPGRDMFAFQLVVDGRVVGDSEPAILGSLMWELQHRPIFGVDQLPDVRTSPDAAVELLLEHEQFEYAMLRGAESLDRWFVWLYTQTTHAVALAQAVDGDERVGPVLVSLVESTDFRDLLDSAVRYWSKLRSGAERRASPPATDSEPSTAT